MSVNGRAGASFEQALCDYARSAGFPHAERRVKNGAKDRGDLALHHSWVIEAKSEKVRDVPGAMREAKKEAANAGVTRYVAVHKYRNHSIADAMVTMPFWLFLEIIAEVDQQEGAV
jgi:hypothetical protein